MFRPTMSIDETAALLVKHGLLFYSPDPVGPISAGIQIDVNAVMRTLPDGREIEASICDHNCTVEVGGYDCGAALSRNKGVKPRYAKAGSIIGWILLAREALIAANDKFVETDFDSYCKEHEIPPNIAAVMRATLLSRVIEANLFGGNPEMHPEILYLISELRQLGFRVNLTTTGRKIMLNQEFRSAIETQGPHLIALSADDVDPDQLQSILDSGLDGIKKLWVEVPKDHGQEQKFLEAVWVLRYAQQRASKGLYFPPILFNLVMHKGNIVRARYIMNMLQSIWSKVLINPYTAQTSFEGKETPFDANDLLVHESNVDYLLGEALAGNPQFTRRLHFWTKHRAIINSTRDNPHAGCRMIAGYGSWHCGRKNKPGYLQIGRANPNFLTPNRGDKEPGGYCGCFWHDHTVTSPVQIASVQQVEGYLLGERKRLADGSLTYCGGCDMPRLEFDAMEMEYKLHPTLWSPYHQERRGIIGY